LVCKPFQRFHHAKVNDACRNVDHLRTDFTDNSYSFLRRHTYDRGLRNLKQFYGSANDIKDSLLNSFNDVYYSAKSSLRGSVGGVKSRVADVVETTSENAKEYYDAGIQKVHSLIEELKQEREKILGA
jgi:predicted RecB family nuclease